MEQEAQFRSQRKAQGRTTDIGSTRSQQQHQATMPTSRRSKRQKTIDPSAAVIKEEEKAATEEPAAPQASHTTAAAAASQEESVDAKQLTTTVAEETVSEETAAAGKNKDGEVTAKEDAKVVAAALVHAGVSTAVSTTVAPANEAGSASASLKSPPQPSESAAGPAATTCSPEDLYQEVTDPVALEAIVQNNPVLRDIRAHGAAAKREDVYPADSTADYVYEFLRHFPPNQYALPQTFRKVIKGLHAGHWLSKKIEEIKNRRWRDAHSPTGKLRPEEAPKLAQANAAFWHLYIECKPSEAVLKKRQEQYVKKTAHNRAARATADRTPVPRPHTSKEDIIHTPATAGKEGPVDSELANTASTTSASEAAALAASPSTHYTEIVDPTAVDRLEAIVQQNPVLLKIREYGPTAKREDVFPTSSTLEAEEYVYTFLSHFPPQTFALPRVFRKVVKGLNSSHWLAKKVDELKNRRWRQAALEESAYGRLSLEEVEKVRGVNEAFWECFLQKKPPDEVLQKKRVQYEKKTANVKMARNVRPEATAAATATSTIKQAPKSPSKLSKKTRLVARADAAAAGKSTFTELVDPTAVDLLEEIVQGNPVLSKIRECGVKAKREEVYPTSTTLQAEEYVFTYLKHFPPNTFALPPTFRKVVKGLNASHWLAKKVLEMKDRRWRLRDGQESETGRMTVDEVEKIKTCNPAFWGCYIDVRPPEDILQKKRKQYTRKTEHNKTSRASKKVKPSSEEEQEELASPAESVQASDNAPSGEIVKV